MTESRKDIEARRIKQQLKQTAAERYADHQGDIAVLIDLVGEELRVHAEQAAKEPKDWGYAGDLGRVRGSLKGVLESLLMAPGRSFYIWGGYANCSNYPAALKECGLYFSQAIIWVKEHPVLTRKDFMGSVHHNGLAEAELPDGPRHGLHRCIVDARVLLVGFHLVALAHFYLHVLSSIVT